MLSPVFHIYLNIHTYIYMCYSFPIRKRFIWTWWLESFFKTPRNVCSPSCPLKLKVACGYLGSTFSVDSCKVEITIFATSLGRSCGDHFTLVGWVKGWYYLPSYVIRDFNGHRAPIKNPMKEQDPTSTMECHKGFDHWSDVDFRCFFMSSTYYGSWIRDNWSSCMGFSVDLFIFIFVFIYACNFFLNNWFEHLQLYLIIQMAIMWNIQQLHFWFTELLYYGKSAAFVLQILQTSNNEVKV